MKNIFFYKWALLPQLKFFLFHIPCSLLRVPRSLFFVINNIDPILIYKLETLAQQHDRSLQEELKHILEQATQPITNQTQAVDIATAREMVAQIQEMFAGRTFRDSAELIREDRER